MNSILDDTERIRRLIEELKVERQDSPRRELARAMDVLPAYVDMGGALVLTQDGEVLEFDFESESRKPAHEPWLTVARGSLARRYDDSAELMPERPADALDCPSCGGTGIMLKGAICVQCSGLGWIPMVD